MDEVLGTIALGAMFLTIATLISWREEQKKHKARLEREQKLLQEQRELEIADTAYSLGQAMFLAQAKDSLRTWEPIEWKEKEIETTTKTRRPSRGLLRA